LAMRLPAAVLAVAAGELGLAWAVRRCGRSSLPMWVRCDVPAWERGTDMAIELDPIAIGQGESRFAKFQFQTTDKRNQTARRVLSEFVPIDGGAGIERLQGFLLGSCAQSGSALVFATQHVYDFLSGVVMAFAADDGNCAAHFDDGTRFRFQYRCDPGSEGHKVHFSSGPEVLAFYTMPADKGVCTASSSSAEAWYCDIGAVRRVLVSTWQRLMVIRPMSERLEMLQQSAACSIARTPSPSSDARFPLSSAGAWLHSNGRKRLRRRRQKLTGIRACRGC